MAGKPRQCLLYVFLFSLLPQKLPHFFLRYPLKTHCCSAHSNCFLCAKLCVIPCVTSAPCFPYPDHHHVHASAFAASPLHRQDCAGLVQSLPAHVQAIAGDSVRTWLYPRAWLRLLTAPKASMRGLMPTAWLSPRVSSSLPCYPFIKVRCAVECVLMRSLSAHHDALGHAVAGFERSRCVHYALLLARTNRPVLHPRRINALHERMRSFTRFPSASPSIDRKPCL